MSTETKFTKGEWRINDDIDGLSVAFNDDGELITDYVYELADAHLISAAPEMYEMLETAMNILTGDDFKNEVSAIDIEKLLAKARGE